MTTLAELLSDPKTAGVWNVDAARSKITFKTKTFWGLLPVKGTLCAFDGDGQVTGNRGVFGRVDIQAASLRTGIGKRDEHLRSADFFDVERFPTISIVVTGAEPTGPESADLRAELTVKDVTRPLTLPARISAVDGALRVVADATIDRIDFGVDGNMAGMVGKPTKLSGDVYFTREA